MAQIVDSYSESNQDNFALLFSSISGRGQSFTGDGGVLNSAKWYLKKTGSPTGNAVAKIYAHSGTFGTSSVPTGAALATSDNFDVSTLTTSFQLITFTFTGGNKITLTNGVNYVVTIEYSGGDVTNAIQVGDDESSPTHAGNASVFTISWSASLFDFPFYVYKDDVTTTSTTTSTSTSTTSSTSTTTTSTSTTTTPTTLGELSGIIMPEKIPPGVIGW